MRSLYLSVTVFALSAILMTSSCTKKEISSIEGTVQNIDSTTKVTIYRQDFGRLVSLESQVLTPKKSSFKFRVGLLEEPTFFQLHFEGKRKNFAVLLLESADKAVLTFDMDNFMDYTIEGSDESLKTKQLTLRISQTVKTLDSLTRLHKIAPSPKDRERINDEYEEAIERQREYSSKFIWENPMSRASVMALYQKIDDERFVFDRAEDVQLFKVVASSLIARYPDSDYSKGMLRDIKNQEKILSSHNLQQIIKSAESSLPEIALPNPKGDTIKLSSLRGKVILLDFWASYNQDNLLENRELLEVYRRYKGKGFEIYQVSLDIEREPWLAAIESAGINWINVSELSTSGSIAAGMYNVNTLPANYLIDRNFEIVGKNLFGRDLENKLKEIL
jgi:peroxiredoxin